MLPFSDRPPATTAGYNYDIIRCPAAGKLRAIITCENLVGCPTHFFRGHTVPCTGNECAACAEGLPWRWHGYVTIFTATTHFHQLLELTAPPAEHLANYHQTHKTLRGCEVILNRTSPRPNGKVRIQTKPFDLSQTSLPSPPDLRLILATMWNLPEITQEIRGLLKGHPQFRPTAQPTVPPDRGINRIAEILEPKGNGRCNSNEPSPGNS